MNTLVIFKKIQKALLFLGLGFVPLFVGPLGILEFEKQAWLLFTVSLAVLIWVFLQLSEGRISYKFHKSIFLPLIFLVVLVVATATSRFAWGSFWGFPQDSAFNLLNFLVWISAFYLIASTFTYEEQRYLLRLFTLAWFATLILGFVSLFKPISLPTFFGTLSIGALAGSVYDQSVLAGLFTPLFLFWMLSHRRVWKLVGITGLVLSLTFLFVASFKTSWIVMFLVSAFVLFITIMKLRELPRVLFVFSSALFAISFVMSFFTLPLPRIVDLPAFIYPSWGWSWQITKQVLGDSVSSLIFGWGPGTFRYAWSQFRPLDILNTLVWNIRFTRPVSAYLEVLTETGVAGLATLGLIILSWLFVSVRDVVKRRTEEDREQMILRFVLPSLLFGMLIMGVFHTFNLVAWTVLWIVGALIVSASSDKVRIVNLSVQPRANIFFSFLAVLLLVGSISLLYLEGVRYYAKVLHTKALVSPQERADQLFLNASAFSGKDESVLQDGALYFLARSQSELARQDLSDQEKGQRAGLLIANAVSFANRLIQINPANVVNWELRGNIYRQIIGLVENSFNFAVSSYEEALKREPDNPYFYLEIGRSYFAQAQLERSNEKKAELFAKAKESIKKAIELKQDYSPAYYQMAVVLDAEGKRKEAISTLEDLKQKQGVLLALDPIQAMGLSLQLGVLYYRDGQYEKAEQELSRVVSVSPNFSNALYFLALSEAKQNKAESAIEKLEKIKELNKENKDVVERLDKIIQNIKEGKDPLQGLSEESVSETLEQKPEER